MHSYQTDLINFLNDLKIEYFVINEEDQLRFEIKHSSTGNLIYSFVVTNKGEIHVPFVGDKWTQIEFSELLLRIARINNK